MRFDAQLAMNNSIDDMYQQVCVDKVSNPRRLPYDESLLRAYREFHGTGEKVPFGDLISYDPENVIIDGLRTYFGVKNIDVYTRHFRPGESEGLHKDPYSVVLTWTKVGTADFTVHTPAGFVPHRLRGHHMIMFNGDLDHCVSAPLGKGSRIIAAFALRLSS